MPSRSLLYKNLYEEIKIFLKDENNINFEEIKQKEEEYIIKIKKEINKSINKAKNIDINNDDLEIRDDKNDKDNIYKIYSERRKGGFINYDKRIKNFLGFNSNIIPGEIVREEIRQIAKTKKCSLYRLEYFTKYYNVKELRKNLLENNKKHTISTIENNENDKEKEETINEIRYDSDEKKDTRKYDISEKNENDIINDVLEEGIRNIIIDDKEMKNKYNIKSTLIRYIFTNCGNKHLFKVKLRKLKNLKELSNLNSFIPDNIEDKVDQNSYQNFYNIIRINNDLPFLGNYDISIAIDFEN
jgi:hypothetical protein